MNPIDALLGAVEAAIRDYDRTADHLRHGPGSDCIRCALVAALPPSSRDRIERSRRLSRAAGVPVDVVAESAAREELALRFAHRRILDAGGRVVACLLPGDRWADPHGGIFSDEDVARFDEARRIAERRTS